MNLIALINFRRAEASGHIEVHDGSIHCPTELDCGSCPLKPQCHSGASINYDLLRALPEYSLTLDELRVLYPELFV